MNKRIHWCRAARSWTRVDTLGYGDETGLIYDSALEENFVDGA
jgi:hypothetical protein